MHIYMLSTSSSTTLINLQDSFCRRGLSFKRAPRMGLKYKEKRERGRKRFLVSFSQSKFSHFSNKKLTSCWNNTLLSAGIGWNFRSVSLLLGHIQPVAIENTACKAALCCKEIVLVVAVGFGLTPFYLYPSSLVYKHQQTIASCLIVAVLQWH